MAGDFTPPKCRRKETRATNIWVTLHKDIWIVRGQFPVFMQHTPNKLLLTMISVIYPRVARNCNRPPWNHIAIKVANLAQQSIFIYRACLLSFELIRSTNCVCRRPTEPNASWVTRNRINSHNTFTVSFRIVRRWYVWFFNRLVEF